MSISSREARGPRKRCPSCAWLWSLRPARKGPGWPERVYPRTERHVTNLEWLTIEEGGITLPWKGPDLELSPLGPARDGIY